MSCHHGAMNRASLRRLTLVLVAALALVASARPEDRWRGIGPGGGGALFHPTVSPHDPRTALVACDMTGNYITTDAGGRWRVFNLGGPAQFFLFDPIDPRVIYAKAGAVFRSSDGGTTWARFLPNDRREDHHGRRPRLPHPSRRQRSAGRRRSDGHRPWRILGSCTSPLGPPCGLRQMAAPRGGSPPTCPGGLRRIWIDPRSSKADRTLYVAGPDAISRREAGGWRTGASPGAFTDVAGSSATLLCDLGGQDLRVRRWRHDVERVFPAGLRRDAPPPSRPARSSPTSRTCPIQTFARPSGRRGVSPRPLTAVVAGHPSGTPFAMPG